MAQNASLTTLSNILKEFYLPPVVEQLNNEVLLLQRLEPKSEELVGKFAVVPVHKARSGGVGVAAEGAALPVAGNQQYDRATFNLNYLYGRVRVTGPSMAKTANEAGAFLQALKSELDGIRNDLKKDLARQSYGSGLGNGLIAQCGVTSASRTVVLATDEALRKGHIHIGMVVDVGVAPGATSLITGAVVIDVNIPNKTFTYDTVGTDGTTAKATITTTASHFVARSQNGAGEITGLQELVSPTAGGTVGGINSGAAGNGYWDNLRLMNGGTPRVISATLLAQARSNARVAGGNPSLMIGSFGVERAIYEQVFVNQTASQLRYVDTTEFKGGYKALDWQGLPFVADVDAPFGKVFFLDEKYLKVFSPKDWSFLDEDGDVLKWVPGFDMWEAVLARYINFGVSRRNVQMVLGDITDTTGT